MPLFRNNNGAWSAVAAPWLVIDGVRLVSGYIHPDGTTTPRDLWFGGGVDTGTPGSSVPFNGSSGSLGAGPPIATVNVSVSPASVVEGNTANFIIFATPNTPRPIVIGYVMRGTARFGVDYTLGGNLGQAGQVTIPLGADAVAVPLMASKDTIAEKKPETASMILVRQGNGYTFPTVPKRKKHRKGPTSTAPAATVKIANGP
jgi:hypothetical protein